MHQLQAHMGGRRQACTALGIEVAQTSDSWTPHDAALFPSEAVPFCRCPSTLLDWQPSISFHQPSAATRYSDDSVRWEREEIRRIFARTARVRESSSCKAPCLDFNFRRADAADPCMYCDSCAINFEPWGCRLPGRGTGSRLQPSAWFGSGHCSGSTLGCSLLPAVVQEMTTAWCDRLRRSRQLSPGM